MAEITWVKLKINMFENEKIKLIEALPDADTIIVIWVKLLAAAGKANVNGFIMITETIPMNIEEMATIFNRPINTVRLALQTFERYEMLEVENDAFRIKNWESHQNIDGLEKVRLQNAERKRQQRARQKQLELPTGNDCHGMSRDSHATDIDKELDREVDKEKDNKKDTISHLSIDSNEIEYPYQTIIDYLNKLSGSNYRHTTKKTQQLIRSRFKEGFKLNDFFIVIDKKVATWLNDQKMNIYLRPETLFGTKFESYLNEKLGERHGTNRKTSGGLHEQQSRIKAENERRKQIAGI